MLIAEGKGIAKRINTIYGPMSARQAAEAIDVHEVTISRLLNGHHAPSPDTAQKLAALMGISLEDVYGKFPGPR